MIKSPTFSPSQYQENIFRAVQSGERALVISACPGSGKTTTIQQLVRYIRPQATVLMVAFNVEASNQLQKKMDELLQDLHDEGQATPLVTCKTIHSLGNGTLAQSGIRGKANNYKYNKIAREYLRSKNIWDQAPADGLGDLLDKARLTLSSTDARSLIDLCDRFEISIDEEYLEDCLKAVPALLQEGIKQAYQGVIDFTDQIWLPHVLNLQPRKYDVVMVDEAQDLNRAQRELVLKAVKRGGQFIAVGDRRQSIYGFCGASLQSIDEIIQATNARELPLSICYRCPVSAVNMAASIYPGIESAPNMAQGEIRPIEDRDIADLAQSGDLILSRTTAPLVTLCFDMLRMGKRATIRGRDLGKSLGKLIETIQKFHRPKSNSSVSIENLQNCAYDSLQDKLDTLQGEENELKRANLGDRIDTLCCLFEHYKSVRALSSLDRFREFIEEFFQENKDAQIILSTGHRAKGLEFPRVFIVSSNKLPFARAKTPNAVVQEYNLMYVMYTRVKYMREVPDSGVLFLGTSPNF